MSAPAESPGDPPPAAPAALSYRGLGFLVSLRWLVLGAALYALLLLVAVAGNPTDEIVPFIGPNFYLTPAFGLPLVVATFRQPGRMRRAVYFLLLVPLAHMGAIYLAWSFGLQHIGAFPRGELELVSGAIGGLSGAAFAFAGFSLTRLGARRRAELATMIVAALLLAAAGAADMVAGLGLTGALREDSYPSPAQLIIWFECVHLPWQLLFALVLAWLMRSRRSATSH